MQQLEQSITAGARTQQRSWLRRRIFPPTFPLDRPMRLSHQLEPNHILLNAGRYVGNRVGGRSLFRAVTPALPQRFRLLRDAQGGRVLSAAERRFQGAEVQSGTGGAAVKGAGLRCRWYTYDEWLATGGGSIRRRQTSSHSRSEPRSGNGVRAAGAFELTQSRVCRSAESIALDFAFQFCRDGVQKRNHGRE